MKGKVSLKGEVIEILENKGEIKIKVSCTPELITIPIKNAPEIHLNDTLKIDGFFTIENISIEINKDDFQTNNWN